MASESPGGNLLALYLADLNGLTAPERWRLAAYVALILGPLLGIFLAWLCFGPSLEQVMGW